MSAKFTSTKPFIVMMYGFPGSGKTSLARQLGEELGLVHLQEDKIRSELFGDNSSGDLTGGVSRVMNYMASNLLQAGVSVAYDANVIRSSDRKKIRELATTAKAASLLVWLQVDPETTFTRTQSRDRRKSDDKYADEYTEDGYRNILSQMQNPAASEGYIVVSGKHTFHTQKGAITKKLYDMGIITPETASGHVVKPGLMNLVPQQQRGDITRRNISIR